MTLPIRRKHWVSEFVVFQNSLKVSVLNGSYAIELSFCGGNCRILRDTPSHQSNRSIVATKLLCQSDLDTISPSCQLVSLSYPVSQVTPAFGQQKSGLLRRPNEGSISKCRRVIGKLSLPHLLPDPFHTAFN